MEHDKNDSVVIIDKNLNSDIIKILSLILTRLNVNIDISPDFIAELINEINFIENVSFIQEQLYVELIRNIILYNQTYNETTYNDDIFLSGNNLCGHVIHKYKNNIIEYCNLDKYLHYNHQSNSQIKDLCDHEFVNKTNNMIHNEIRNKTIINMYQSYLDTLYINIYNILIYYIYKDTQLEYVSVYNIEKINIIFSKTKYMKIFKEKHKIKINNIYYIKVYSKIIN